MSSVRKKIAINALYVRWGFNGGTETYLTNIVEPWYEKASGCIGDFSFVLFCSSAPPWWDGDRSHFQIRLVPSASRSLLFRILIEQTLMPLMVRRFDLIFNPGYVGLFLSRTPQVTTVHDGFAWVYPKQIGLLRAFYWRTLVPLSVRKALRVIAVSKSTAEDIKKYCRVENSKLCVIHEGGAVEEELEANFNSTLDERLAGRKFVHCVGLFKEIKNPYRILDAFRAFKEKTPNSDLLLVLVGRVANPKTDPILAYANQVEGVLFLGRLSDLELRAVYANSMGLIFPSLYEGFGIPILEAQSAGCPVVTSNVSSMPEVAGSGAILVDPYSTKAITSAIDVLAKEETGKLIQAGFENAAGFSWTRASDLTFRLILDCLPQNPSG